MTVKEGKPLVSSVDALLLQSERISHEQDICRGLNRVYLPTVLGRNYSNAGKVLAQSYFFPSAGLMEAALDIAKACPFLEIGGLLEVSELMQMSGQ